MAETGFVRFPGALDPGAQEFIPRNPTQITHFGPPPPLQPPPFYYPYPPPQITEVLPFPQFSAPATYVTAPPEAVSAQIPPPAAAATRAVFLTSVPSDVSEMTVWREMDGFGEVRWVQMERACEGIVTVHFYDLRHAETALREIRDQYMQHQDMLRNHYSAVFVSPPPSPPPHNLFAGPQPQDFRHHSFSNNLPVFPFPSPPGRGLIAGQAVWAQFVYPVLNAVPDGHNQGTIVIFHLDPAVTTSALRDIFQAYGEVKELRETPAKKHQRFVEFFDVRDAARALMEMDGKEINGKPVVIEFSRPGGHGRKYCNAAANTSSHGALINYPQPPPPPPPQELDGKFSRRTNSSLNVVPPRLLTASTSRIKWSNNCRNNIGSPSKSSTSSIESKMAGLNLNGTGSEETGKSAVGPKRTLKKSSQRGENSEEKAMISPKARQQQKTCRGKKGRQVKKMDSRFLIKEDAISEYSATGDARTTVMIKNIPNKYSQKLLLNMLDNHCIHCNEKIIGGGGGDDDGAYDEPLSAYDFVYLPIDFNNKCNVGYGFVNMTSPEATWRLYKAFHLQHWEVFNSRKICEVTYARVQGLEALKEHFKNSKFPCEMEHYLPVVFSPPRDGRQLTEPLPIVAAPTAKNSNNHHHPNDDSHPVSLLLPSHHHLHQHHAVVDTDAPVSACDSDDYDSSGNGGVNGDDDVTK